MNQATLKITNIQRRTTLKGFVHGSILVGLAAAFGGLNRPGFSGELRV